MKLTGRLLGDNLYSVAITRASNKCPKPPRLEDNTPGDIAVDLPWPPVLHRAGGSASVTITRARTTHTSDGGNEEVKDFDETWVE